MVWIHLAKHAHHGPVLRTPDSILFSERSSASSARLVELSGTGRIRRSFPLASPLVSPPLLDAFGRIILVDRGGKVRCLDSKFQKVWAANAQRPLKIPTTAGPGGEIYVAIRYSRIVKLTSKGSHAWATTLSGRHAYAPALDAHGMLHACTGAGKKLHKLRPTGQRVWQRTVGHCAARPLVTAGGLIIVPSNGRLLALTGQGKPQWDLTHAGRGGEPVVGHDGTIYLATTAGQLLAVSPKGRLKWAFPVGTSAMPPVPAIGPKGTVYVAAPAGHLMAVSPQAKLLWHAPLPNPAPRLAVRHDSSVVAVARNDSVRLIAPPKPTPKNAPRP